MSRYILSLSMNEKAKSNLKKIVLVTSGQPSINPRLVKEADSLAEAGYSVQVIYQYRNHWATALDEKLLPTKKWTAHLVGGSPLILKTLYLKSRINYKLAQYLFKLFGPNNSIAEKAIGRCTALLGQKASALKADLYIGHNLAALPAIVQAAKKNNAKCGFDAEDFHRNEQFDNPNHPDVRLKTYIENKYIPQLDYLSTASPMITAAYANLYPNAKPQTILNVFTKPNLKEKQLNEPVPLKMFWFSQTIGTGRGLEVVIEAMGLLKESDVELHLLGSYQPEIVAQLQQLASENNVEEGRIFFYPPILQDEIFDFASNFDVGLATETGQPMNRDICLTNKLFTYIQSGLAVLASDTLAQKDFLKHYQNLGYVFGKDDKKELAHCIASYINDKKLLQSHKKEALMLGNSQLNWEIENNNLLQLIAQIN